MRAMVRVLLVDPHIGVRQIVRTVLQYESDMEVIGEAEHGAQATHLARTLRPDIVLMDVPGTTGIEAIRALHETCPSTCIIGLSTIQEPQPVLDAGAAAVVSKTGYSRELLLETLRSTWGE